jgi:hypothetical protein
MEELYQIPLIAERVKEEIVEINPSTKTDKLLALLCEILARNADMKTIETLDLDLDGDEDESSCFIS